MPSFPELYILSNGESVWQTEGRVQGKLDSPLTPKGREQARHQNALLKAAGVTGTEFQFLSSPLGRARETADIAHFGLGGVVREDERLADIGMGRLQGLNRPTIEQRFPDAFAEKDPFFWYNTVPGGEGFDALQLRMNSFLASLRRPVVIVTHTIPSRFLRGTILGLDRRGMAKLKGGVSVVFHLKDGKQTALE